MAFLSGKSKIDLFIIRENSISPTINSSVAILLNPIITSLLLDILANTAP
jgi:hypothetical protein